MIQFTVELICKVRSSKARFNPPFVRGSSGRGKKAEGLDRGEWRESGKILAQSSKPGSRRVQPKMREVVWGKISSPSLKLEDVCEELHFRYLPVNITTKYGFGGSRVYEW